MGSILTYQEYTHVPGQTTLERKGSLDYGALVEELSCPSEVPTRPVFSDFCSCDLTASFMVDNTIQRMLNIQSPDDIESATWVIQENVFIDTIIVLVENRLAEGDYEGACTLIRRRLDRGNNKQALHVKIRGRRGFSFLEGHNDSGLVRWTNATRLWV